MRSSNLVDSGWLRRWLEGLERTVLPPVCLLCGAGCHAGAARRTVLDLCAGCLGDLPRNRIACPRCALPLEFPAPACGECLRRPPPFTAALIPFRYAWPLDRLVTRFKFDADLAAGRALAEAFVGEACTRTSAIDTIAPVPLHRKRLRQRGYNQSLELAKRIGRSLGVQVRPDVLVRLRHTEAQAGLAAGERRRNVRGAFEAPSDLAGASVALFDDVVTTGATAAACARALKLAGASRVELWAIARAPAPGAS